MPPLDAALALAQVTDCPSCVTDHLYLDVAGPRDHPLHVNGVIAEGQPRFRPRSGVGLRDLVGPRHDAHAATAATTHGLDHHLSVVAEPGEESLGPLQGHRFGAAGQYGDTVLFGQGAGPDLVAE